VAGNHKDLLPGYQAEEIGTEAPMRVTAGLANLNVESHVAKTLHELASCEGEIEGGPALF
jgi:hypothetical protein